MYREWFPSPCGDYGSYQIQANMDVETLLRVGFRPLAGIMVLIKREGFIYPNTSESFRPLAGIMVLIGGTDSVHEFGACSFRPLAGIMVLINRFKFLKRECEKEVSVPLRGLWFLSFKIQYAHKAYKDMSFRPLAGIMVLISYRGNKHVEKSKHCFRPLAGIMVLIEKMHDDDLINLVRDSFRPLAGIMVLIFRGISSGLKLERVRVSVPLRGLWFLSGERRF